jgi:hypothetical protein
MIRHWVEAKIRRHLMRSRLRKAKGWKRWSSEWIYRVLGVFNDYKKLGRLTPPKVVPAPEGVQGLTRSLQERVREVRSLRSNGGGWSRPHGSDHEALPVETGATDRPSLRTTAPVLDPTP